MTRDLQDLTIELEGITDHINMLAYAVYGEGFTEVDITDKAVASQLWEIANHLDRINEDINRIDSEEAEAELEGFANAHGLKVAQGKNGEPVLLRDLV